MAVDLVRIRDVAVSVNRFGDRYLRRVYTDHELQTCRSVPGAPTPDIEPNVGLATRFAAKSATVKALGRAGLRPDLRTVEVLHHPEGSVAVTLTGETAAAAAAVGLGRLSVTMSHGRGTASAVAVALCDEPRSSRPIPDRPGRRATPSRGRAVDERIRALIDEHARLPVDAATLGDDEDLYGAGLTSHAGVTLLLALEDSFGVGDPSALQGSLRTLSSIRAALGDRVIPD